jgi:hypothetical protein
LTGAASGAIVVRMTNLKLLAVCSVLALAACGGSTPPAADPASATSAATTTAADADGDGIADGADKCPDKKEDGQAPDPKDGCPKS